MPVSYRVAAFAALLSLTSGAYPDSHTNTLVPKTTGVRLSKEDRVTYFNFYTRVIRLKSSGKLLATHANTAWPFPIFQSDDDGLSWKKIGDVPAELPGGFLFAVEPHLYELPEAAGDLPKGAILLAGASIHFDEKIKKEARRMEIFVSLDQGKTWRPRGVVDSTSGKEGPIWEPVIYLAKDGKLVCIFSDERLQPKYNQCLVQRVSADGGKTWGPLKVVVGVPDNVQRPGMAVVERLPNGKFVMSYEWINGKWNPAYVRFSDDGVNWGPVAERGVPVQTAKGATLGGTPTILWVPTGGPKGALVVSARDLANSVNTDREMFVNYNLGEGPWVAMPAPVQWQGNHEFAGWSTGMVATADNKGVIQIAPSYAGNDMSEILIGRSPILIPGQTYSLVNKSTGMAITITNDSTTKGTLVTQQPSKQSPGQVWRLVDLGEETFGLVNPASGLALDDWETKTRNDSPMAVWEKNLLPFQQWHFLPNGDGTFRIHNVNANRVLGLRGKSKTAGANIVIWDDDGSADHNWELVPTKG